MHDDFGLSEFLIFLNVEVSSFYFWNVEKRKTEKNKKEKRF